MRTILIVIALAISACKAEAPRLPSSVGTTIEYPHYKRPNLVVADLERSLTIYRDILGFEAAGISESSSESFSYPVFNFPAEARLRSTYLGEPGETRIFGLTEVKGIDLSALPNAPHGAAHVIGVTSLTDKIEKVRGLGLKTSASKTAGGAEFQFIEQAFTDYDGHLIVLYEVLPE